MARAAAEEGIPRDLADRLDAVPFAPKAAWQNPRRVWLVAKGGVDFVAHNIPPFTSFFVRVNPYPKPWTRVRVPVDADGTQLGGWFAEGEPGRPAVVYAPGTFQTKDDSPRKATVIRLWRDLGYHVLAVDMRGFGESHAVWGTGGYVEAQDLHAAAAWLSRRVGVDCVALHGDSLGGASAFIAASLPGAEDMFSCVLAWSPFADLRAQAEYATDKPSARHPYYVPYWGYRFMTWLRSERQARDFNDFLRLRSEMLDLTPEELVRRSSPVTYADRVRVPTLVHHAANDPIVPVQQARILADATRGNPFVRVRILDEGGHATFEAADPAWFVETVRIFVDGFASPAGGVPA